jgi:tetratricopeptide (TPR) repeat protein
MELVNTSTFSNNKEQPTMTDLVQQVIKPRTHTKSESYAEYLAREQPSAIKSTADYFVSYVWAYPLQELMAALEYTLLKKLNQQDVFIWLDGFCVNQHMKSTVTPQQLQETFGEALKAIGKVAMVLVNWRDPSYSKRIWCVFEAYMSKLHKIEVTLAMSQNEEQSLVDAMMEEANTTTFNFANLNTLFGSVNVEKATAKESEDQQTISKLIHEFGVADVNGVVLNNLKQWIVHGGDVALSSVDKNSKQASSICLARGAVHYALGEYNDQLKWLHEALKIREQIYDDDETVKATILNNKALCLESLGQFDEALKMYDLVISIFTRVYGPDHPQVATGLNNKAGCLNSLGKTDEARTNMERALEIHRKTFGNVHPDVALTLWWQATLEEKSGNVEKTKSLAKEAIYIFEQTLGPNHQRQNKFENNFQLEKIYLCCT